MITSVIDEIEYLESNNIMPSFRSETKQRTVHELKSNSRWIRTVAYTLLVCGFFSMVYGSVAIVRHYL